MKIYLAGSYKLKDEIQHLRTDLIALGIEVTSRWLDETYAKNVELKDVPLSELITFAKWDLEDIDKADAIVQYAPEPNPRGGAHVEFGYAIAKQKKLFVVGPPNHLFHQLPEVIHFNDWSEALNYFECANYKPENYNGD